MAKLMEDEKAMLPDDGVSPIDSENKYFFFLLLMPLIEKITT